MKQMVFRNLRASEVEVRPAESKNGKATLLLYQNARCAMNILDETVGPLGWQKEYYDAKGLLICRLGIVDEDSGQWIWKSDTGSESNIEADKGLASDAFKRAAVLWGIGRELYSSPRITVSLNDNDMYNGRLTQSFYVSKMDISEGEIVSLCIVDKWGNSRFSWEQGNTTCSSPNVEDAVSTSTLSQKKGLLAFCKEMKGVEDIDETQLLKFYKFYSGPSKSDPTKTIEESFDNFNAPLMWQKWMANAKQS